MTDDTRLAVYELRLTIKVPLDAYAECDTLTADENAVCAVSKREIEQMVTACLRRLGSGDVTDIEVINASVEEE